jgi:hypothetical protein
MTASQSLVFYGKVSRIAVSRSKLKIQIQKETKDGKVLHKTPRVLVMLMAAEDRRRLWEREQREGRGWGQHLLAPSQLEEKILNMQKEYYCHRSRAISFPMEYELYNELPGKVACTV